MKKRMENKIRNILSNLKSVQEDLLALSDDLWLEIDHNDNNSMEHGVKFKSDFNMCNLQFTQSANSLSDLIQNYTNTPLYTPEERKNDVVVQSERERIIKELNTREPHSLSEDFKYKRPFGFVLENSAYENKLTWSEVYNQICTYLHNKDASLFESLGNNPDHISNRNNKYFSRQSGDLRSAQKCGSSIFIEMNLSANQIRDSIIRLLKTFKIQEKKLIIYFREDRDA